MWQWSTVTRIIAKGADIKFLRTISDYKLMEKNCVMKKLDFY
jgi:hypothetical protein